VCRKRYCFSLEDSIMNAFRAFIVEKQGTFKKGDISKWTETAFRNLISLGHTQQQNTKNLQNAEKTIFKISEKWQQICKYVLNNYDGFELKEKQTLPIKILNDALNNICGIDERTQQRWIKRFQGKYIKKISIGAYEVIRDAEFVTIEPVSDEELK
jgi:hypothetical protein